MPRSVKPVNRVMKRWVCSRRLHSLATSNASRAMRNALSPAGSGKTPAFAAPWGRPALFFASCQRAVPCAVAAVCVA
jgi:hypothetical protein